MGGGKVCGGKRSPDLATVCVACPKANPPGMRKQKRRTRRSKNPFRLICIIAFNLLGMVEISFSKDNNKTEIEKSRGAISY